MNMSPSLSRAWLALALAASSSAVHAAADGDGVCTPEEASKFECANFGPNVVEFLGSEAATQCQLEAGPLVPCTAYYYRYTGGATNQLAVAIPARNTKVFKTADDVGCSQFLTNGVGDPTTGFGKNQATLNVCRIARTMTCSPRGARPPVSSNFVITVDPSAYDSQNPLDWQLKKGSSRDDDRRSSSSSSGVWGGSILGPFSTQPGVVEAAVTLTTPTGETVSYANIAGNVTVTGGNARVVAPGGTKLCVVNPGGDPKVPYTSPDFAANWTCETITYTTEQCDIRTDGGDPCRMIGGTCIKY
ncbi:MAG: hypothetical protein AB7I01_10170 [Gammaproteobacteria bacterium]